MPETKTATEISTPYGFATLTGGGDTFYLRWDDDNGFTTINRIPVKVSALWFKRWHTAPGHPWRVEYHYTERLDRKPTFGRAPLTSNQLAKAYEEATAWWEAFLASPEGTEALIAVSQQGTAKAVQGLNEAAERLSRQADRVLRVAALVGHAAPGEVVVLNPDMVADLKAFQKNGGGSLGLTFLVDRRRDDWLVGVMADGQMTPDGWEVDNNR